MFDYIVIGGGCVAASRVKLAKAAKRLLVRLLKKQSLTRKRIVTDKFRSYG